MKAILLIIINLFIITGLVAQNSNELLELKIENDKLALTDKYYTSGVFLTYKKHVMHNLIFKKTKNNKLQLNITIGNEAYTPTNLNSTDTRDFDRPYAGWLFSKIEIGKIKYKSALFISIETGITGKEALSAKIQTRVHKFFNIDIPTWVQEIEHKFLANLKARYIINKMLSKSHTLQYVLEPSLGTKDIYIRNSLEYTFGGFNTFNTSSKNGFIDTEDSNEFFGFINLGYKYVAHNTLIQGSLNYNDEMYTTNRIPHVFEFKIGSTLKKGRYILNIIYNFNTTETPKATSHSYGTLSLSRTF